MMEPGDDALIEAARGGDAKALAQLLEHTEPQIYRFGIKMCRDPEHAKDVLQDTLLAVARNIGSYRKEASFSTWLYSIARSFCIKHRRTSKFAPKQAVELSAAGELADPAQSPSEQLASKQLEDALDDAIASLEPMYREVLVLRDVEGLPAAEVAEVLGIGVPAVKSRLHRARLAVRERLAPWLEETSAEPAPEGCPDVLARFSEREEGELTADQCAEMEKHLASCGTCRGTCETLRRTLALCRASATAVEVPRTVRDAVHRALRDVLSTRG